MNQTLLRESVKESPVKTGDNRWRVIVAKPGKGSSGTYSAEVFKRDAQKMVPPGAQSFFNHDEKRDPRDMLGYFPDGAVWSEEDQAVIAELSVFESWKPLVEQLAPHVGISLYALGEIDDDGNVTSFIEDAYNGADLVSRPGLKGAGFDQKLYEAARSSSTQGPSAETSVRDNNGKDVSMDEQKIKEMIDAALAPVMSALNDKAEEAAQKDADDKAVAEAVEAYDAAVTAITEAELLPSQAKALRAEAKAGRDIAPLIESYKEQNTEAEEHFKTRQTEGATAGRVITGDNEGSKFGAWK